MPRRTLDELTAIAFTRYTHHVHPYWRREFNVSDRSRSDRVLD